ncbi:MFS transporter [Sanguibacter suaedae]|uniref:MFS transporter n=1 Tax=Sanguibacter suaedae TaxID=2795737 RepID=A0A934MEE9_9MICO|nr:MFS transporter [Sanguibacter suaedae]MBI9115619.1 MFS transporter [Sanguibacter suaedae]
MKRSFSFGPRDISLVAAGCALIAATYGLVRLAFGLFLPDVQADLGLADTGAGLVSSGASLVYCVGALVGFVVGPHRPRALVVAAALTAGGGAAGMAAAPGIAVFAVAAILASAGAGLASPALVTIVHRSVTSSSVDRAQTMVNAGTGPGLVAAGILALVLLPGWRLAWMVIAVVTGLVALLVLRLDHGADTPRGPADPTGRPSPPPSSWLPPRAWFVAHSAPIVAALLLGAGSAGVWTYGRAHLVAAGVSETTSVTAWIALGAGGAAVIVTARHLAMLRPPAAWTLTAAGVALASAALGLLPGVTTAALAACVAFGWAYTAGSGVLIAWTADLDAERASSGTSLLFVALVLGQALGSAGAGGLAGSTSTGTALLAAAAVSGAAAVVPHVLGAGRGRGGSRPDEPLEAGVAHR